jgi:hypothetical protein
MRISTPTGSAASAPRRCGWPLGLLCTVSSSRWLQLGAAQIGQAFEVEDPADQIRLLPNAEQPAPTEPAQPVPILALPEELFDLLPRPLGQLVPEAPPAHPDSCVGGLMPAGVHCDVRRDAAPEQRLDEANREEALVPAEGGRREAEAALGSLQQRQAPRGLGRHGPEDLGAEAEEDPVPILHEGIRGPRSGRMRGDIEVQDSAPMVSEDDQDKEHPQLSGGNGE